MSVLRLLLGRRQFLAGFAGSVLALGLWKSARAIDAVFQTNIANNDIAKGFHRASGPQWKIRGAIRNASEALRPATESDTGGPSPIGQTSRQYFL
mgnify:CR=1 FL=1